MSQDRRTDTVRLMGLPVSRKGWNAILADIDALIESHATGRHISITNTESMYHALRMPEHAKFILDADLSLCDGVGVCVVGRFYGVRIPRRNGPDLQLRCCEYGQARGWRHFFYGGKEGVAEKLAANLKTKYPDMICAGTYTPPFRDLRPDEEDEVVALVNASRPDIVWVGLGLVKQERWIVNHLARIQVPWMVGVGGAFDYHAGVVPWAPRLIRRVGLEWLFRLVVQPRLRGRRYWWSLVFVVQGMIAGIKARATGRSGDLG